MNQSIRMAGRCLRLSEPGHGLFRNPYILPGAPPNPENIEERSQVTPRFLLCLIRQSRKPSPACSPSCQTPNRLLPEPKTRPSLAPNIQDRHSSPSFSSLKRFNPEPFLVTGPFVLWIYKALFAIGLDFIPLPHPLQSTRHNTRVLGAQALS